MNAYFFNITPEERVSILDKHKHIYNGYQALQPNVPNPQPLYVQDYANDKEGITINNKGEVMTYRNHNINESVKEGNMCECGGMVYEGECMECGEAYKKYDVDLYDVEDLNPKNKFDYVEGEMDEVRVADLDPEKSYKMKFPTFKDPSEMDFEEKEVKYKGMVKYQDGKPMYQFTSKDNISGAMLSPKNDDDDEIEDVYDEEINEYALNYDYKEPAYQFSSKGPVDAWDDDDKNYFEDSIDVFDDEELQAGRAFADMGDKDEWSDEKILMTDWELQDFAVQVVREDLKNAGRELMSWNGSPEVSPSLWFVGDDGPEWVVVRAYRFPNEDEGVPENIEEIKRQLSQVSVKGNYAGVGFADMSEMLNMDNIDSDETPPIYRGNGLNVNYQGLKEIT